MKRSCFLFYVVLTAFLSGSCSDTLKDSAETVQPDRAFRLPDSLRSSLLLASFVEETPGGLTVLAFTDDTRSTLTRTRYAGTTAGCDTLQALGSNLYRAAEGGVEYVVHDAYVVVSTGNAPHSSTQNCNITMNGLNRPRQYPRNDTPRL